MAQTAFLLPGQSGLTAQIRETVARARADLLEHATEVVVELAHA